MPCHIVLADYDHGTWWSIDIARDIARRLGPSARSSQGDQAVGDVLVVAAGPFVADMADMLAAQFFQGSRVASGQVVAHEQMLGRRGG